MKICNLLLISPLILAGVGFTACQSDTPVPPSATEEYVRQFVTEFGAPAQGHSFSMATTAGLQVKSSHHERITVTAEIDGVEYAFADLTVNPGVNPIPVTIPSAVNTLFIYVGFDKYAVAANQTFDLDNPGQPAESRGYTWDSTDRTFSVNTDGNPVIAFKYGDFLKQYFQKYPEGTDNTANVKGYSSSWYYYQYYQNYGKSTNSYYYCETAFGDTNETSGEEDIMTFDIFPIYWRTSDDGKNYGFRFTDAIHPDSHIPVSFGGTRADVPFPKLGTSTAISSVDQIDFNNLGKDFTFDDGSFDKAFSKDNDNLMIVSEGITVTVPKNMTKALFNLDVLTYLNGGSSDFTVSSSGPYINSRNWNDNYFRTTLTSLVTCAGSTKRTMLDKHLLEGLAYNKNTTVDQRSYNLSIYNPGTQELETRNKGVLPFILGFNSPAKMKDDASVRDYANVVFLVVPRSKTSVLGRITSKLFPKYYWTIAAEDLGGSFDWDFNDAVFSFWELINDLNTVNNNSERLVLWGPKDAVPVREINVWANAAGGTMPLYVTYTGRVYKSGGISMPSAGTTVYYSDKNNEIRSKLENEEVLDGTWVIGTEIHKWLARSTYTEMFNTGENREIIPDDQGSTHPNHKALSPVQICVPVDATPAQYAAINSSQSGAQSAANMPLLGFAVLVDKNDDLKIETDNGYGNGYSIAALPEYKLGEGCYLIGRPDSSKGNVAPQMLLIPGGTCESNAAIPSAQRSEWEWPRERVNIKEAYPDFEKWVKNPTFDWTKNVDRSKVTKKN